MVFGNYERDSGTGVLFSRNPMTGTNEPFGEWLPGGQGEDVVSGSIDVEPITALRDEQPAVYHQLITTAQRLEQLHHDIQDIEFTVEEGALWLLQTRTAKRSAQAAVRLALQLRHEGLIDDTEALRRVTPAHVETLLKPALQPETRLAAPLLATGLPACPGVVSGRAYCDVDEAIDAADRGEHVILVRPFTSPDDVHGMIAAAGIITETGGATSHAAVVSREIGRPTIVGCGTGLTTQLNGRHITIDATQGEIRDGILQPTTWTEETNPDLHELNHIAHRHSPLRAHTTGDYPHLDHNTEDEIRKALQTHHHDVISPTPLITMLTALRLARDDHHDQ
jgi:pyruvate,orthophosphate dikinase